MMLPEWADPAVPESELDAQGVSRRGLLKRAGLFGAGLAAATSVTALPAPAQAAGDDRDYVWLVGDHHVHTVFSHDAKYRLATCAWRRTGSRPRWAGGCGSAVATRSR